MNLSDNVEQSCPTSLDPWGYYMREKQTSVFQDTGSGGPLGSVGQLLLFTYIGMFSGSLLFFFPPSQAELKGKRRDS